MATTRGVQKLMMLLVRVRPGAHTPSKFIQQIQVFFQMIDDVIKLY